MAKGATKPMYKRIIALALVIIIGGFSILLVNLFKIQILNYEFYQKKAIDQQTRDISIAAERGTIYDKNGKILAASATAYLVYVAPASIKSDEQKQIIISGLPEILGTTPEEVESYREKLKNLCEKKTFYEIVERRVEQEVSDKVLEFIKENKLTLCLNIAEDPKRYYPFGSLASHIIGFTGSDNQGLAGIEQYFDSYLSGIPGRIITATNAKGSELDYDNQMYIEPQNGNSIVLTIDEVIQHFLEKTLEQAVEDYNVEERGAGIIMNAKTGEILAMAVKPDFDLNEPFTITDEKVLASLAELSEEEYKTARSKALNEMWRNKAISDQYMPGSVYKTITAAIALEEDAVTFNDSFTCTGGIKVEGWSKQIGCDKRTGHGTENFVQGFYNSCNPVFITVGLRVGIEKTYNYASAFGFFSKTGIQLPGEAGRASFIELNQMSNVDLAVYSFGQNFKITPLQMVTAIAASVNGGYLLEPRIVKEIIDEDGNVVESFGKKEVRQVISEETSQQIRTLLESVVTDGSGRNSAIAGYRIGGKTGTSEKTDKKNENGVADKRLISFMSVAPADDPEIVMLLLLDEPNISTRVSGGLQVAPMSRQILSDVLPYLGIEPTLTVEELLKSEVNVPNVVNMSVDEARKTLTNSKLSITVVGDGDTVKNQLPYAGQKMTANGKVVVYTGDSTPPETTTVPNIVGLSASRANQALINAGLSAKFNSTGGNGDFTVYSCSPAVGETVKTGSTVSVEMRITSGEITN